MYRQKYPRECHPKFWVPILWKRNTQQNIKMQSALLSISLLRWFEHIHSFHDTTDPLTFCSDYHLISTYSIAAEWFIRITRTKEMITDLRGFCKANSHRQQLKECVEDSAENMHTDVRVLKA